MTKKEHSEMKLILGGLARFMLSANPVHIIWGAAFLIYLLILAVLHHRWKDDSKKLNRWRLLCLLLIPASAVHYLIYGGGWLSFIVVPDFFTGFLPLYLIAVFALLPVPFAKRKTGYRISAVLTGILTGICGLFLCCVSPHHYNHARESYTESFHSLVRDLDRTYVLKEWKDIDFAALEAKYMPAVQKAEQEQNPAEFCDAVMMFCNELHDEHVNVVPFFQAEQYKSDLDLHTHEYGLSMVQLDSGDVIAVCTTEAVQALGIDDGTVITEWDGKPVQQALAENVRDRGFPVKANADRLAPFYLANEGGDAVTVSFLDKAGAEQTVTLTDLGKKHTRTEALCAFRQKPDIRTDAEQQAYDAQNFSTKMLNDKCGYLKVQSELMKNEPVFWQYIRGHITNWENYRSLFREKLAAMKAQGMESLVIDLRNNTGGFSEISMALCDLLTPETMYGAGAGIRRNGQYQPLADYMVHGTGEFADLNIVALTNYKCASAGDELAYLLAKMPNVTLAGITDPCGISQAIGGISTLSGNNVTVEYPTLLVLNEDGEPNIDTRADRISRNPAEVRIPLDYDAAMKIFRDGKDYELDWAVDFLKQHGE